jgi:hypothetical protein
MATNDSIRLPWFTSGFLAVLALLVAYSLFRGPAVEVEQQSSRQLTRLSEAVSAYHIDHGFYPGSRRDFGYPLNDEQLRAKLLRYSDASGQSSETPSHRFRFGPYLDEFPADPRHGSQDLSWALGDDVTIDGADLGGWIYAPERGVFVARSDGLRLGEDLASF